MSKYLEHVARAIAAVDGDDYMEYRREFDRYAKAALEAVRDADNDMLKAMHDAMFTSKFTGGELPMLGAGFEAAIDYALSKASQD